MTLAPKLYADLIGKPFARGVRGPDAYDCWGTLQCVLRRIGHEPTDFPSRPELLEGALCDEWGEIARERARPGDGVLLRSSLECYRWHIGVIVDGCRMLHARESVGVCVERYDSPQYLRRIVGFYRYRGRA